MALFTGAIGQYTTPDGRQVTMPADLASSFPALQPYAPPVTPGAPQPTPFSAQDQADLAAASAPPPPVIPPADAAPITHPSQVSPPQPQGGPRGPVTNPAQQTEAGGGNTPQPVTNKQLETMGPAGAANLELQAQEGQRGAVQRQGEALANQATAVGNAMESADKRAAEILEQRRQYAEQRAAEHQQAMESYFREAKSIADTKVDRSVDHPVLAALSVALTGIGQAMGHQQIDVMSPLYKAIDRKVAGQMQELDRRRQGLALQRDAIGMQREDTRDRLAEMDTYRLAYLEQAKRQVETIKQSTSSDVIRANSDVALSNINAEQAKTVSGYQARVEQRQEAKAARDQAMQIARMHDATARRGQDIQQRESDLNRAERAQEKLDERATQIVLAQGKDAEKKAKEVREQGVVDPKTADPLLTPAGAEKMAQADKEEALARKASDPAQAQKLNQHAQALRQSAQTNDIVLARDTKDREKVQQTLDSTHNLSLVATNAVNKLKADPAAWDRTAWADLKADLAVVKARYVATLGERVSVRALEAFDTVLSIDADDAWWSRSADKGKAIAALKTLQTDAAINADVTLKGAGIKSQWKPGMDTEQTSFGGKTAAEVGADARPGGFRGDVEQRLGELGAQTKMDAAQEAALGRTNAKGQVNSYGLDPADNEKLRGLVEQSGTAGHAKYNDIAKTLAGQLTSDRPGWATAVARLVRDSDPKLYYDMLNTLEPSRAREIDSQLTVAGASPTRTKSDLSDEELQQFHQQENDRYGAWRVKHLFAWNRMTPEEKEKERALLSRGRTSITPPDFKPRTLR